jgi:hypothetical protein
MKERIVLTVVLWLIGNCLQGYHLSRNPVRKKKDNGNGQDKETIITQEG